MDLSSDEDQTAETPPLSGDAAAWTPLAPSPPGRDLSGPRLLWTLRRNSLAAWPARAYRDTIVHRRFLGTDCYLLNDPAAIRHVLTDAPERYVWPVSARRLALPTAGKAIAVAEGAEWRAQRRMLSPAFTPKHVDGLLPVFMETARLLITELIGTRRTRLGEVLDRAAIEAAGRSLFGLPMGGHATRLSHLLRDYFTGPAKAQIFDFLARRDDDFAWMTIRRGAFRRRWFAEVDAIIAARRAIPPRHDLFMRLLEHEGNPDLPPIRDQVASLLSAGFATTSLSMFWTMVLLAGDPAEQAAVRAELRATPPSTIRSGVDFAAWPRLRATLLEALRLYPPISVMPRVPIHDDVAAGVHLPAGALVLISPWVMHRHEAYWPDPARFRPERFWGESPAVSLSRPGYLPFGGGSRICLGASLALTEATVLLAHLLARFRVTLEPGQKIMPRAIVTTRPDRQPWFLLADDPV